MSEDGEIDTVPYYAYFCFRLVGDSRCNALTNSELCVRNNVLHSRPCNFWLAWDAEKDFQ